MTDPVLGPPPVDRDAERRRIEAEAERMYGALDERQPSAATPRSDVQRLLDVSEAIGLRGDRLYMTTIPGPPWSKARPRFSGKRAYADRADTDAEQRTAWRLRAVVKEPFTGNVGLGCLFFRPNRQRIDVDNLIKHVFDAGNGILWADDSQCTAVFGFLELDAASPRTVVIVGEHRSTLKRGDDLTYTCQACGTSKRWHSSLGSTPPRTCGAKACVARVMGHAMLDEPVPCAQCGELFVRVSQYRKFCSPKCRADAVRDRPRPPAAPMSICWQCGKELAHRRGGRCRECWRADPHGNRIEEAPPPRTGVDITIQEAQ